MATKEEERMATDTVAVILTVILAVGGGLHRAVPVDLPGRDPAWGAAGSRGGDHRGLAEPATVPTGGVGYPEPPKLGV